MFARTALVFAVLGLVAGCGKPRHLGTFLSHTCRPGLGTDVTCEDRLTLDANGTVTGETIERYGKVGLTMAGCTATTRYEGRRWEMVTPGSEPVVRVTGEAMVTRERKGCASATWNMPPTTEREKTAPMTIRADSVGITTTVGTVSGMFSRER